MDIVGLAAEEGNGSDCRNRVVVENNKMSLFKIFVLLERAYYHKKLAS